MTEGHVQTRVTIPQFGDLVWVAKSNPRRRFTVTETEHYQGSWYVRAGDDHDRYDTIRRDRGAWRGATVVRRLGYHLVGQHVIDQQHCYVMLLGCGHELSISSTRMVPTSTWTGAMCKPCEILAKAPKKCRWCGTMDEARFGHEARTICRACGRTAGRRGRFPCGKPRRKWIRKAPVTEHLCPECAPWLRSPPKAPSVSAASC